jgi:uncharacterized DUF497 family protein
MDFSGFDWDDGNTEKCKKHGLSKGEVESIFQGFPSVFPDPKHSTQTETRFLAIGPTVDKKMAFVAFTVRQKKGQNHIRPISPGTCMKKRSKNFWGVGKGVSPLSSPLSPAHFPAHFL